MSSRHPGTEELHGDGRSRRTFYASQRVQQLLRPRFLAVSPEMIFRAFSAANGYRIMAVLLHEVMSDGLGTPFQTLRS